jgi:putative flavoprotein involved in K+ transport
VLVVGSGQTGCQLAEELVEAGRDVFLACGRAPWLPRRIGDRDLFAWMADIGFMDATVADLPDPAARLIATPLASGHGGGHDLHYRTLQASGVTLLGHLVGLDDGTARFAPDLARSVTFGDARYAEVCTLIREWCAAHQTEPPDLPTPPPFDARAPEQLRLGGVGAVIFTTGFRPDYTSWVPFPGAFDEFGFPIQVDGSSTVVPGFALHGCPLPAQAQVGDPVRRGRGRRRAGRASRRGAVGSLKERVSGCAGVHIERSPPGRSTRVPVEPAHQVGRGQGPGPVVVAQELVVRQDLASRS